ncbi:MAG: tRNA pseudouridine(13) synthase TruD [Planctomycetes bacterium]|nr:tRNA pseudouridine(13) synthase TruD [Planctomycetota bacterium]
MRFLSAAVPPCRGVFKSINDDFRVDEIPLYPFSGSGTHTLVRIEKSGISTFEALRRVARALDFPERDVGFAGMKDSRGITRQWLSLEHVAPERVQALDLPRVRVLEVTRHGNKLKRGHLAGNRFEVLLRDTPPEDVPHARATLELLARRGVPNWYDAQRFGRRQENARLGLALLKDDLAGYLRVLLGEAESERDPALQAARKAFDDGDTAQALALWPQRGNLERTVLKELVDRGPGPNTLKKLPQKVKLFQLSAAQSLLFNRALDRRFPAIDRILPGDVCQKENGACFVAEDAAAEQPRADAFEISPTGPIFGYKMLPAGSEAAAQEQAVLAEAGLTLEQFDVGRGLSQKGDRRDYRFRAMDVQCEHDAGQNVLSLRFTLPKGCYATVLLKEITKQDTGDLSFPEDD